MIWVLGWMLSLLIVGVIAKWSCSGRDPGGIFIDVDRDRRRRAGRIPRTRPRVVSAGRACRVLCRDAGGIPFCFFFYQSFSDRFFLTLTGAETAPVLRAMRWRDVSSWSACLAPLPVLAPLQIPPSCRPVFARQFS